MLKASSNHLYTTYHTRQTLLIMFSHLLKPTARSAGVLGQRRYLATVHTNTAREISKPSRKATPISLENATFTIKVCTLLQTSPHIAHCF